jgi:hypothetical protein
MACQATAFARLCITGRQRLTDAARCPVMTMLAKVQVMR